MANVANVLASQRWFINMISLPACQIQQFQNHHGSITDQITALRSAPWRICNDSVLTEVDAVASVSTEQIEPDRKSDSNTAKCILSVFRNKRPRANMGSTAQLSQKY